MNFVGGVRHLYSKDIHVFITSRLDYFNSLYGCVQQSSLRHLQLGQNAAAHDHDHITPGLASLHWFPVKFRTDFEILLLVFMILNGLVVKSIAPSHSIQGTEVDQPDASGRPGIHRLKIGGDRAFAVAASNLWKA